MIEKSPRSGSFYRRSDPVDSPAEQGREQFDSLPTTAGPWSSAAQHGGPPSALLTRALERLPEAEERAVGRVTVDLLGPVPVGPLATSATILRTGRTVCLAQAELHDLTTGRTVARAGAWLFPRVTGLPVTPVTPGEPLDHTPDDGLSLERPADWLGGYLDAVEWRWIAGTLDRPGPGVVWMRAPDLVEGEETSGLQRLMACVDSASGASAALDVREWAFPNTELTVHVLRPPVGEWLCLDATTTLAGTAVGVCTAAVHDRDGLVARSSQALLVAPRA